MRGITQCSTEEKHCLEAKETSCLIGILYDAATMQRAALHGSRNVGPQQGLILNGNNLVGRLVLGLTAL